MSRYTEKTISGGSVFIYCLCFILGLPAFGFWYYFEGPGYLEEVNFIRKQLNQIPGVEVVDMKWIDDLGPEHILAEIAIEGKGRMLLAGLEKKTFTQPSGVLLYRVGEFEFRVSGEHYSMQHPVGEPNNVRRVKSEFSGGGLSTGEDGRFSHLFPFELVTVQDAVEHYEEIYEFVSQSPQPPEKGHFKDEDGLNTYYWVESLQSQ